MKLRKRSIVVLLVGAALTTCMTRPGNAFAGVTVCDTDPVVTLSNGAIVSLNAKVYDTQPDLLNVSFELHIPRDLSVTNVQYDSTYGSIESFTWFADERPSDFWVGTTATTVTSDVHVHATMTITGMECAREARGTDGVSGQTLTTSFRHCR